MEENIIISKKKYYDLLCAELKLSRLECGGVDNWEWYGESLHPDGELSLGEEKKKLHEEIFGE